MNVTRLRHRLGQQDLALPASVQKRNGAVVDFDVNRVERAIEKCYVNEGLEQLFTSAEITQRVAQVIASKFGDKVPTVEQVQDAVELTLLTLGEYEAAKRYIRYRDQRSAERGARLVPDDVREAFDRDKKFFETPAQEFMHWDKYSRFNWELGRRETWLETVDRCVEHLKWEVEQHGIGAVPDTVWNRIHSGILHERIAPSMRLLAMAGEAAQRNSMSLYNCFAGTERYLTRSGLATFAETVDTTQTVLNGDGKWVDAEIKEFGIQPLVEITFRPGHRSRTKIRHRVQATRNHRWITKRGETTDLQPGDEVRFVGASPQRFVAEAWIRGFGFGDGTLTKHGTAQVRLCGEKNQRHLSIFEEYGHFKRYDMPTCNGDPTLIFEHGHFGNWKQLPYDRIHDGDYLASWLQGYIAADGDRNANQYGTIGLASQNAEAMDFVKTVAPLAGMMVVGEGTCKNMETNFGMRSAPLQCVRLRQDGWFKVTAIEDLEVEEPVYCAVVPDGHDFVLANGIHTGNCSYLPIDSIDSFVETLLISMAGCGVGFSVEREHVEKFPRIARQTGEHVGTHVIDDSTEGWGATLRLGLETWWRGADVDFDESLVRPAGSILRTKGGRASGPDPLMAMLQAVRSIVLSRQGGTLHTVDAHLIECWVGEAAVQGGVRRTAMISLFDWDDFGMRVIKNGATPPDFSTTPTGQSVLWNANNSAVWPEDISNLDIVQQLLEMAQARSGEPGIFSRANAIRSLPERRQPAQFGTNPCGEIILRPFEFCNLSQAIARPGDTTADLYDKVELATIIGVIQSLSTRFPGLREDWKRNCEDERLLGVDLTAQRGCELLQHVTDDGAALRRDLMLFSVEVSEVWARTFGINPPAANTCDKPAGNSAERYNVPNGLHAPKSRFIVRRYTVGTHGPMFRVLLDAGAPMEPRYGSTAENATQWILEIPRRAPDNAPLISDLSAVDQCEFWLLNKVNWTEHNPSCTITYRDGEFVDLVKWICDHKNLIGGLSFFPELDAIYKQAPFEAITEEEYDRRVAEFPDVDYALLYAYEIDDMTTAAQELACFAGDGTCAL